MKQPRDSGEKKHLLLISEDQKEQRRLKSALEPLYFSVVTASSDDPVKEIGRVKPALVLMDVPPEGLDRAEKMLRPIALEQGIPALLFSSLPEGAWTPPQDLSPSLDYLKKPSAPPQVIRAIELLLAKKELAEEREKSAQKIKDLTRKHAKRQKKIRLEANFYKALIENTAETIAVIDKKGIVKYEAPAIQRLLGWDPAELKGKNIFNLIHPEELGRSWENLRQLRENPERKLYNRIRVLHKDGTSRVIEGIRINLTNNPAVRGIVLHYWDITDHENTEKALRESEEKFDKLVVNLPVSVMLTVEDKIRFVNPRSERLTGYSSGDLRCMSFSDLFCAEDRNAVKKLCDAYTTGEAPVHCPEFRMLNKRGELRWVFLWAEVTSMKGRQALIFLLHDITENKNREGDLHRALGDLEEKVKINATELLETNRRLQQEVYERIGLEKELRNKNHELEDFAYRISHDLRNNLIVLKKLVESTQSDPELIEENLAQLADDTDHLIRFIETLLELARAGMIIRDRTDISIPFLVKSLIEKLCPTEVQTEFIFQPAFPLLKWDPTGVEQVFSNLIKNSCDFHDPAKEKLIIELGFSMRACALEVWFRDNGIGIPKELQDGIFDITCTTKRTEKFGFGLAIVKKIIEAHRGSIRASSDGTGRGATFVVLLPFEMMTQPAQA